MAAAGLHRSPGSSDVFFKIVFWLNLRTAVGQHVLELSDDALDLLAIKFRANPNDETGNTIHVTPLSLDRTK